MSFFSKVVDLLGIVETDDGVDMEDEAYATPSYGTSTYNAPSTFGTETEDEPFGFSVPKSTLKNSGKVTTINSDQIKMIVINPDNYDEAREICDYIKDKKPVVVNLESMDFEIAQRVMDFLSGSCYSLNGNIQRVARNIFIVAPNNIDVTSDFKSEYKGKNTTGNSLAWMSFNKTSSTTPMSTTSTTTTTGSQISPSSLGLKN